MSIVHTASPAWPDTRQGSRHSVYRPVLVQSDTKAGLCLLRDVSPDGLRATANVSFARDELVEVHFSTDVSLAGAIAWSQEKLIGVQLHETLNVPEFLSQFSPEGMKGKAARAQRLPIRCDASLTAKSWTGSVQLVDVSLRGAKIKASFLQPGDEVELQLEGLDRRKAVVRWIDARLAGLSYLRPLAFEELAKWVACQQDAVLADKS
jgi:hypothetical protein